MRYRVRRPYRYGDRVYMPGEAMPVKDGDVKVLQQRGIIGAPVVEPKRMETATQPPPPERAVMPEPGPKYLGGGWYLVNGRKVRKSQLEDD